MASRAGILIFALTFLAAACNLMQPAAPGASEQKDMSQRVEFYTTDQVKIVGDYYPAAGQLETGVILLHMMPATRSSWQSFGPLLESAGFAVLAIDLRGHGESGGGDYQKFTDAQHQASRLDVAAAAEFLAKQGIKNLAIVGASFGANLALQFLADNPQTKAAVLLSPGVEYRGLMIAPQFDKILKKNQVLLVGAADDTANMGETCEAMAGEYALPQKICYPTGGHGTNLFITHPDLLGQIIDYLKKEI